MMETGNNITESIEVEEFTTKMEKGDDDIAKKAEHENDKSSLVDVPVAQASLSVRNGDREVGSDTDQEKEHLISDAKKGSSQDHGNATCAAEKRKMKSPVCQLKESDVKACDSSAQPMDQCSSTKHKDADGGEKSRMPDQADFLVGSDKHANQHSGEKVATEVNSSKSKEIQENLSNIAAIISNGKKKSEHQIESRVSLETNTSDDSKDEEESCVTSIGNAVPDISVNQNSDETPTSKFGNGSGNTDNEHSTDSTIKTQGQSNGTSNDKSTTGCNWSEDGSGADKDDVVKERKKFEQQIMVGKEKAFDGVDECGGDENNNGGANEEVPNASLVTGDLVIPDETNSITKVLPDLSATKGLNNATAAKVQVRSAPDVKIDQPIRQEMEQMKAIPEDEDGDAGGGTGDRKQAEADAEHQGREEKSVVIAEEPSDLDENQKKIAEADAEHQSGEEDNMVIVHVQEPSGEKQHETELQDDDLMDFTYSQVCQMEEQCLATEAKKELNKSKEVSRNVQVLNTAGKRKQLCSNNVKQLNVPQNHPLASTRKGILNSAAKAIPSTSSVTPLVGASFLNLSSVPSASLRSEDVQAGNVVKGVIVELKGLNHMILGAKKQIQDWRRKWQVIQRQQQQPQQQVQQRQMGQQRLQPSTPRQMGFHRQQQPQQGSQGRMFPPEQ